MSQGRDSSGVDGVPVLAAVKPWLRCSGGREVDRGCAPAGLAGQEESRVCEVLASSGCGLLLFGVPGLVLVVAALRSNAAVEDADEPVGEGAESLVVGGAAGALAIVEFPSAG